MHVYVSLGPSALYYYESLAEAQRSLDCHIDPWTGAVTCKDGRAGHIARPDQTHHTRKRAHAERYRDSFGCAH
jgi:hypothetical protein